MSAIVTVALALCAVLGALVVATRSPERQAVVLSLFGLALTVLFVSMQAPDVALSELGVGAAVVPLMVMLAVRRIRRDQHGEGRHEGEGGEE
jgi:uncharacterized MnhB-related membrane protein